MKEAAYAVCNATSGGTAEQILYLAQNGVIPPLSRLLQVADAKVVIVALEGLENILRTVFESEEDEKNQIMNMITDSGVVRNIKELQVREG